MDLPARNIAYFRTTFEPEATDGAVGWAVAEPMRAYCQSAGAVVGPVEAYWDGVRFACRSGRVKFSLEITPYFEAEPMEWSVQIAPRSFWKFVRVLFPEEMERPFRMLDGFFGSDHRYTLLQWQSLPSR